VCDDAYIVLRYVEQLHAGNGAVFNIGERAQGYTSALWFMALVPLRLFTADLYLVVVTLSLALCLITMELLRRLLADGRLFLAATCVLVSSNAVMDYASGGLENPLGYALLLVFVLIARRPEPGGGVVDPPRHVAGLALVASLAILVRHDLALLVLPGLGYLLITEQHLMTRRQQLGAMFVFILPLALWSLFALLYYGVVFPNTYYAKIKTGIPRGELVAQGARYLWVALRTDPVTMLALVTGTVALVRRREPARLALALGPILYLLYVVWCGGGFMRGRFLSYPTLMVVALAFAAAGPAMLRTMQAAAPGLRAGLLIAALATATLFHLLFDHTPLNSPLRPAPEDMATVEQEYAGISDERAFYQQATSLGAYVAHLRSDEPHVFLPRHPFCRAGKEVARAGESWVLRDAIGYFAFCAGNGLKVVDVYALTDPFLARLPQGYAQWRVGHYRRAIPLEYKLNLSGRPVPFSDPARQRLFMAIKEVSQGEDLWSSTRLKTVLLLNSGSYDL
jgi:arabinofuranosyltransferase